MTQSVKKELKIPKEVKRALRDDNLVFFCGSGISISHGLPDFESLVKKVCKELRIDMDNEPSLQSAIDKKDYADILTVLENSPNLLDCPKDLRKKVIEILSQHKEGKPEIHKALLDLSALSDGKGHRLVTTNFDKLFLKAGLNPNFVDSAPKLDIPQKGKWKNLTFLHGVIDPHNDPEGSNLVLTESDFGAAYQYDGWASDFIIKLFQEFTILFIGYGINDPVMKPLFSAITAEHKRRQKSNSIELSKSQRTSSIYAFVEYERDKDKDGKEQYWTAKGITPIFYKVKNNDHSVLYDEIKKWAELKNPSSLTERKKHLKKILNTPYTKTIEKEKVGKVISDLKEHERLAEYLPEINLSSDLKKFKPIDIKWLIAFAEERKGTEDSLLEKLTRPTTQSPTYPIWEPLSYLEKNIVQCLSYHLNDRKLIQWLIKQTSNQPGLISLHPEFKNRIKQQLNFIQKDSNKKLDERQGLFWEIITNQEDKIKIQSYEGQRLINTLNQKYSYEKARKLLFILEPQIGFRNYFYDKKFSEFFGSDEIFDPKLVMKTDTINYPYFKPLTNETCLLRHAEDWTDLLKRAMELAKWSGLIKENEIDFVCEKRACIEKHGQNENLYSWTYLIDLVRDSFNLAMEKDKKLAKLLLSKWQNYPYSLFYRLILYAVTEHPKELNENIVIKLFEEKPDQTLWSSSCRHEVLKFLEDNERKLSENTIEKILPLIMKGPPWLEKAEDTKSVEYKEKAIYFRLDRLKSSEISFLKKEEEIYKELSKKYSLKLSTKENAEFISTQIDSKKQYKDKIDEQFVKDIKSDASPFYSETRERFKLFVKDIPNGMERAFQILSKFTDKDFNSAPYWMIFVFEASVMTDKNKGKEWVLKVFDKIENFSDDFLKKCLWGLIRALNMKDGLIYYENKEFFEKWWFKLWDLSITKPYETTSDIPSEALNSNLGKLSESIIQILWRPFPDGKIKENAGIPEDIKKYFEIILQSKEEKNVSSLFHFGSDLSQLWYLDKKWTIKNLKPLMSWEDKLEKSLDKNNSFQNSNQSFVSNENARKALWEGYLFYNMFMGADFLEDFKEEFFDLLLNYKNICQKESRKQTFSKFNDPNNSSHEITYQYVGNIAEILFITTGGRNIENIFSEKESKEIFQKLDINVLECLARYIWILLKDTESNKTADLWSDNIKPWVEKFWPKQTNKMSHKIAETLSLVILNCGDNLPEAFNILRDKIEGIIEYNSGFIVYCIINNFEEDMKNNDIKQTKKDLEYIYKYPRELLQILNWIFPEDRISYDGKEEVELILKRLKEKYPDIEENKDHGHLYKKLLDKIT